MVASVPPHSFKGANTRAVPAQLAPTRAASGAAEAEAEAEMEVAETAVEAVAEVDVEAAAAAVVAPPPSSSPLYFESPPVISAMSSAAVPVVAGGNRTVGTLTWARRDTLPAVPGSAVYAPGLNGPGR